MSLNISLNIICIFKHIFKHVFLKLYKLKQFVEILCVDWF